jgi:hypothetical protein
MANIKAGWRKPANGGNGEKRQSAMVVSMKILKMLKVMASNGIV